MKTWILAACSLLAIACGGDDANPPASPEPRADAGGGNETPDAALPELDAGVAVRSIVTRSPFGDLGNAKSYVLDGDFELSMTGNVVPAWYVVTSQNQLGVAKFETGGRCASGTLCLALADGESLLTYDVTAPPNAKLTLSLRAKPASGACTDVTATLYLYDRQDGDQLDVKAKAADAPDASGWCLLAKDVETGAARPNSVLQIVAKHAAVIDDVGLVDAAAGNPETRRAHVRPAAPATLHGLKVLGRTIRDREQLRLAAPRTR